MAKRKPKKSEFDLVHATIPQIRELKSDIAHLEKMYDADQRSGRPKIQDKAEFDAHLNKKRKELKDHEPKKFRGPKSNKAYTEAKRLRGIIQDAMPTRKEHEMPAKSEGGFDFERAVQREIAYQTNPKVKEAIRQYKHIMRRIDPSDPTITNLELLRK